MDVDFVLIPSSLLHDKDFRALKKSDRRAFLDAYVHIVEYYVLCDPHFQTIREYTNTGFMGWKIRGSKTGIAKTIEVDPASFRAQIWPTLIDHGLLEEVSQRESIVWFWV